MKILNEYEMEKAYYALVDYENGLTIELKLKKSDHPQKPTKEEWYDLATHRQVSGESGIYRS